MTATASVPFGLAPQRRRAARVPRVVTVMSWASLIALFGISNLMLARFGIAYETTGGAAWQKIAPSTYLAMVAMLALFATRPDLAAFADEIVRRHKGLLCLFAAWALLFFYIVKFQGGPLTATFDTFLMPMALFLVLPRLEGVTQRRMALFLHIFMALNALIGIAEFAIGFRITPIVAVGMEITSDYRSTALLGHPLNNAANAACYALILMLGGGRDLSPGWRAAALLLQLPALAVFGGRFATVAFVGFAGVIALKRFLDILNGRRFSRNAAAAALVLTPTLIVATILLVTGGFLDKFLMRFVEDEGSAATRLAMLDLIAEIPFNELLVGPSPEYVSTLMRLHGIGFGIESFWVGFLAYYGILVSVPFFVGLTLFLVGLARRTTKGAGWAILMFILICSTSASLSGKTMTFGQFMAMLLLLMRLPAASPART